MSIRLSTERVDETEGEFNKRLDLAKGTSAKTLDIDKIVSGFEDSLEKFKGYNNALIEEGQKGEVGWVLPELTLLKMKKYLRDMKIFLVLIQISDCYQKVEYCNKDTQWWLSKFTSISNIAVDSIATLVLIGENFLKDVFIPTNSTFIEIQEFNGSTTAIVENTQNPSYFGVAAITISVFFSKLRTLLQARSEHHANQLAKLSKVIIDGEIILRESQNSLALWEKTADFMKRDSHLTKREFSRFTNDCSASGSQNPVVQIAKGALLHLYKKTKDTGGGGGSKLVSDNGARVKHIRRLTLGVDATIEKKRSCCSKTQTPYVHFLDILKIQKKLQRSREIVATVIESMNKKSKESAFADYQLCLKIIQRQLEKSKKAFEFVNSIPVEFFKEPQQHKVYRALGLVAAETIAMVTEVLEKYEEDIDSKNQILKIVSLLFFMGGAIFSAFSTVFHKKEMNRLKLIREIERIKAIKEKILPDLEDIQNLLQRHQNWVSSTAARENKATFDLYRGALKDTKPNLLGLNVQRFRKRAESDYKTGSSPELMDSPPKIKFLDICEGIGSDSSPQSEEKSTEKIPFQSAVEVIAGGLTDLSEDSEEDLFPSRETFQPSNRLRERNSFLELRQLVETHKNPRRSSGDFSFLENPILEESSEEGEGEVVDFSEEDF